MKQIVVANRMPAFPESAPILSKHLDEKRLLAALKGPNPHSDSYVCKYREALVTGLNKFFQHGCYDEDGIFNYRNSLSERIRQMVTANHLVEGSGFITPDKTPDFYQLVDIMRDSQEMTPDTSYLDFMVSTKMTQEIESRREWNATFEFVLMKEAGQVKFGQFATRTAQMVNDEWGSGMELSWTWLETNQFRVKFARLAPKFKYASFNQKADNVYMAFLAAGTTDITGGTNVVIKDINIAINELMRYEDDFVQKPFENATFTIVARPEDWWYLDQAFRLAGNGNNPGFFRRPRVTFTTKLSAATAGEIYVIANKWEQNEFATRLPLEVHGPQDDIAKFATMMTYREAYGAAFDGASIRKITLDPTDLATFSIGGAQAIYDQTPAP